MLSASVTAASNRFDQVCYGLIKMNTFTSGLIDRIRPLSNIWSTPAFDLMGIIYILINLIKRLLKVDNEHSLVLVGRLLMNSLSSSEWRELLLQNSPHDSFDEAPIWFLTVVSSLFC